MHADAFDVLGKNLVNSHPSRLTGQMESDDWYRLRWKLQDPLPPLEQFASSSVICSTTSASPDYVVWQLIEVNGATADWRTAIPCVKNSVNWASAVGQNLPGVDPAWVKETERLQPFDPGHAGQRPEIHPLAILDQVNNLNKHRLLPAMLVTASRVRHTIKLPEDHPGVRGEHHFTGGVIEDGAEHFRARVTPPVDFSVIVDKDSTFRISFRDGLGRDWRNRELIEWVRTAIAVFEPAFPA